MRIEGVSGALLCILGSDYIENGGPSESDSVLYSIKENFKVLSQCLLKSKESFCACLTIISFI
jgi:hypothetical protein